MERNEHDARWSQARVEGRQVFRLRDDGRQRNFLCGHLLQAGGDHALGVLLARELPVRRAALAHAVVACGLGSDDPGGALHVAAHLREPEALRHVHEEGLQDQEARLGQSGQRLVAVAPLVEVHLPDGVRPENPGELQEQLGLHAVLRHEGQPLQISPPAAKLPAQRLDDVMQLGVVEVDKRPREQLGDPSADARRCLPVARAQGPLVEGLDVAALRVD
mmetsp:Transcript_4444/g.13563  ORF Transcript_4444/g.13563 Transcript_4444/m.13563 type:complete len:219 (+) Transcript_4444:104-760(+)